MMMALLNGHRGNFPHVQTRPDFGRSTYRIWWLRRWWCEPKHIGGFPKMGVPPVVIHLRLGFSRKQTIQPLGYSHFQESSSHVYRRWFTVGTTKLLSLQTGMIPVCLMERVAAKKKPLLLGLWIFLLHFLGVSNLLGKLLWSDPLSNDLKSLAVTGNSRLGESFSWLGDLVTWWLVQQIYRSF